LSYARLFSCKTQ